MLIQNLERNYIVIQKCDTKGDMEQFVCRDADADSDKEYRIAKVRLNCVTGDLINYLFQQKVIKQFKDFIEYFTDPEFLYIVTVSGNAISLNDKLMQEECTLSERIEIGKCLLEHIILLGGSDFFYCSALGSSGIRISESMQIQFQYDLSELCHYQEFGIQDVLVLLAERMRELYRKELELKAFSEMEYFIKKLLQGSYSEYIDIYADFQKIYGNWNGRSEDGLTSQRFSFRLWDKIKQTAGLLKKMAAVFVLLIAAAYLIWSIQDFVTPQPAVQTYSKIGSLEIENK